MLPRRFGLMLLAAALAGITALAAPPDDKEIDFNKARQLLMKEKNGERLSPEEKAYLDRAKEAFRKKNEVKAEQAAKGGNDSTGLVPLTDLGDKKYKGETGGLYGNGANQPPEAHAAAAKRESAKIRPLDSAGRRADDGKIVLLSIGMSNTTQEFSLFKQEADRDSAKSPRVVNVDGAQGGQAAEQWTDAEAPRRKGPSVWEVVEQRLKAAGVTPQQVQVVWIKQALIQQGRFGEFPAHAKRLEGAVVRILQLAKERYPNLRIAYLSSRIYAGYATTPLNPEPYAYEGAFSIRWVIQRQIQGDKELNFDADRGKVVAPLVLWGPYLWADGVKPREGDKLTWQRQDLSAGDGTHPSNAGRKKVADLLLQFFKNDPYAKSWFVK
jgi:hypothetical protein